MKKQLRNTVLFLMCIPLAVHAYEDVKLKHEKSKSIKKEFTVNADALLKINNRYGNVDVISWNGNKVLIEVKITVSGNNEDKVIKRLGMIDVSFEARDNMVSAKTIIEKKSSSWSWSWGNNSNVHYQIDYKIKVPITNRVDLNNDYGNITLNELEGDASINCDYGKIIIGDLLSHNNKINIDYTNDSSISLMNGGSINADYSKFTVENAGNISLNADYTTTVFENIKTLNFNCDYGSLKIIKGTTVKGDGSYLTTKVGTITENFIIKSGYGSIKIENLSDGFKELAINSNYTGIKIGVPKNDGFNFELKLSYGSFKRGDDNNYELTKQIVKSTSKYYEGYLTKQNNNSTIKIDSRYGSVSFY